MPDKREFQQIASNQLSDIEFKDFMKLFEDYTKEPYSFLVKDTTLPSDNPLRFWKNLYEITVSKKSKQLMKILSKIL